MPTLVNALKFIASLPSVGINLPGNRTDFMIHYEKLTKRVETLERELIDIKHRMGLKTEIGD